VSIFVDREDFFDIKSKLEWGKAGFIQVTRERTQKNRSGIKLIPPRKSTERIPEICFEFHPTDPNNDLKVVVWTTFRADNLEPKKNDSGWIIIVKKDDKSGKLYYSSPKVMRTTGFVLKLCRRAWVAMYRVRERPKCPLCGRYMEIVKKGIKSKYWQCINKEAHENTIRESWDYNIKPIAKKFIDSLRKKNAKYVNKRKKAGKPLYEGIKNRKKWKKEKVT
jgi:hypothetical protein